MPAVDEEEDDEEEVKMPPQHMKEMKMNRIPPPTLPEHIQNQPQANRNLGVEHHSPKQRSPQKMNVAQRVQANVAVTQSASAANRRASRTKVRKPGKQM